MTETLLGIGASPGRALGPVRRLRRAVWRPRHRTIPAASVDGEVARLQEALAWAAARIRETREEAARSLGEVEAHIEVSGHYVPYIHL